MVAARRYRHDYEYLRYLRYGHQTEHSRHPQQQISKFRYLIFGRQNGRQTAFMAKIQSRNFPKSTVLCGKSWLSKA